MSTILRHFKVLLLISSCYRWIALARSILHSNPNGEHDPSLLNLDLNLLGENTEPAGEPMKQLTPPVIDISLLFQSLDSSSMAEDDDSRKFDKDLRKLQLAIGDAVQRWGFFSVTNHNIPQILQKQLFEQMRQFFALSSPAVKHSISRSLNNSRGFTDAEFTKQLLDRKEVFDVGHKPRPDLPDDDLQNRVVDGYNQWPDVHALPEFRAVVETYYEACVKLSRVLLNAIFSSIAPAVVPRLEEDYFDAFFANHTSFLRLNYYPTTPAPAAAGGGKDSSQHQRGVSRPTDAGVLTLLLQDSVPGLEVYSGSKEDAGDGHWCPVDPVEGALTINIG